MSQYFGWFLVIFSRGFYLKQTNKNKIEVALSFNSHLFPPCKHGWLPLKLFAYQLTLPVSYTSDSYILILLIDVSHMYMSSTPCHLNPQPHPSHVVLKIYTWFWILNCFWSLSFNKTLPFYFPFCPVALESLQVMLGIELRENWAGNILSWGIVRYNVFLSHFSYAKNKSGVGKVKFYWKGLLLVGKGTLAPAYSSDHNICKHLKD